METTDATWNALAKEAVELSFYPLARGELPAGAYGKLESLNDSLMMCPSVDAVKKMLDRRIGMAHSDAHTGDKEMEDLLIYHFGILFNAKETDEHDYRNIRMMLINEELELRLLEMMRDEKLNFYLHYNYSWFVSVRESSGFIFRSPVSSKTAARLIHEMPCEKLLM